MNAHVSRALVCIVAIVTLLSGAGRDVRAQDEANTYIDPGGLFTLRWSDPWTIARQEGDFLMLADGTAAVSPIGTVPLGTGNLQSCLHSATAVLEPGIEQAPVVEEGHTTWRSWVAYFNEEVGAADYFECQIVPGGAAAVVFLGSMPLDAVATEMPILKDFLATAVVRTVGEPGPVLTDAGWRVAVVEWTRGAVFSDLGLTKQDGKEWVVVAADVANWRAATGEIAIKSFALRPADGGKGTRAVIRSSVDAATELGELPADSTDGVSVPAGQTRRVVLVFSVQDGLDEFALALGDGTMLLEDDRAPARFVVLRPPADLPSFDTATVTKVLDGRTLRVKVEATGKTQTIRLIGLDVPAKGECYSAKATSRLKKLAGKTVLLEQDGAPSSEKRLLRQVWANDADEPPVLLNARLIGDGAATVSRESEAHRFDGMLLFAEQTAKSDESGLWGECEIGQGTDGKTVASPEAGAAVADA